jgi:hypothetical protein
MRALYTPQRSRALVITAVTVTLMSPVFVLIHFFVRMAHGDYPSDADSIGIPVFSYWILVFPFSVLFLVQGLRRYTPNVSLLAWNSRRVGRSTGWTLLSIFPLGMNTVGMILDGIYGHLYWISAFFSLHLVVIATLRASVVMYEPDAQQVTPANDR